MAAKAFEDIIGGDKPVLVDFSAKWCGPCQVLDPILVELKEIIGDEADIIKIDVDKNKKLARSLKVRGVPTLMIYQKGKLKWRGTGVLPAQELKKLINQHRNTIGV